MKYYYGIKYNVVSEKHILQTQHSKLNEQSNNQSLFQLKLSEVLSILHFAPYYTCPSVPHRNVFEYTVV